MSKPCAVLAAVRAETQRLNVSVTKKIGFKLGGDDSKDAIVHITGYGYTLIDGDADFRPDDDEMEVSDDEDVEASDDSDDSENGDYEMGDDLKPENNGALKRIMKKVDAKEEKTEGKASEPKREPKADAQFKTHKTGLKLQDLLIGSGKAVKSGRNVGVEYVLRLESGKVVDKTRKKQPFKFRLGIGECIKGFDIGIAGKLVRVP